MAGTIELSPELEQDAGLEPERRISLCETLDRVLNKGVVLAGEIIISVADIDLVYLNVQVLLASVETARRAKFRHEPPSEGGSLQWSPSGP
jgi:gas vesicle structural protein